MGRIFSYSEIAAEQVPDTVTFELAKDVFVEAANLGIGNGLFDGSFIYGSVAIGQAGRRSDFDALVATSNSGLEKYLVSRALVQLMLNETGHKIPMIPIINSVDGFQSGRHGLDRFFGQHLTSSHRLVQGNDPAGYMTFAPRPAVDVLADYLAEKKRKMADTFSSGHPLDLSRGGLQRMLELPPAIGRKILQVFAEMGCIAEPVEQSADKKAVLKASRALFARHGLAEGFDMLVTANEEYDETLDEAIKGKIDEATYNDVIVGLHNMLPSAANWIDQIELTMLPATKR